MNTLFLYRFLWKLFISWMFIWFRSIVNKVGRAIFPSLEYTNEWQPVGGDPLKGDPVERGDYLPPVLDRVKYWAESSNQNKKDILLLGVPSKNVSPMKQKDKFIHSPVKRTFYSPPYQSHYSSPIHQHYHQKQYVSIAHIKGSSFKISFCSHK